jgi:hypothetical protein
MYFKSMFRMVQSQLDLLSAATRLCKISRLMNVYVYSDPQQGLDGMLTKMVYRNK